MDPGSRDGFSLANLTPTEQRLLATLRTEPGRAFTRAELLAAAIPDAIVLERTIDVHIRSLRQKLPKAVGSIETVRGVGYRYSSPEAQQP